MSEDKKESNRTTISIGEETKRRIAKIGRFGDTLEDVVKRLLDFYESKNKKTDS